MFAVIILENLVLNLAMRINMKLVHYLLFFSFILVFFSFSATPAFSQSSGCEGTIFFYPPAPECTEITPVVVTLEPETAQAFTAVYTYTGESTDISFDWSASDNGGGSFASSIVNPATYTTPSKESGIKDGDTIGIDVTITESLLGRSSSCPTNIFTMSVENIVPVCTSLTTSPSTGNLPLTVAFVATGTDSDGTIVLYEFDFGDGSAVFSTTGNTATHTYSSAGTITAAFRMQDDSGGWSESATACQDTIVATTPSVPPETYKICENCACVEITGSGTDVCSVDSDCPCTPECVSISANPTSGRNPLLVSFSAVAVAPGSSISSYTWDFGEGVPASTTTASTSHSYSSVGTFIAKVHMSAANGNQTSDTPSCEVTITVSALPAPTVPEPYVPPEAPTDIIPVASPSAIDTGTESSSFYIALAMILFSLAVVLYFQFQPKYNYVQRVGKMKRHAEKRLEEFEKKFE